MAIDSHSQAPGVVLDEFPSFVMLKAALLRFSPERWQKMLEPTINDDLRPNCPTAEELIDYREGKTKDERDSFIREHLATCNRCVATLLMAARTSEPSALEPLPDLTRRLNEAAPQRWEPASEARAAGAGPR